MKNPLTGAFRALSIFNFRVWTAGALVSNIGTWMQRVAQDWLVLTQLTHQNASALGVVMALQFAPQLLLLPWSGLAADRFNQRRLLMFTQAAMGVLALALGGLTIAGVVKLWQVYGFAFLFGCAAALDAPVRQTFVAELVGDEHLHNAVALNSTSFNAGRMIGPAVAGIVIAKVGTGWAFAINGLSFAAVLISISQLRLSALYPNVRATAHAAGGFLEGFRYVWGRTDLRAILVMLFLIGTFGLNFPIFISTMAVKVFHTDARGFGLLSSIMAIGTIAGALISAGRKPKFGSLFVGSAVFGTGCALAALAPGYWWFAAALMVVGIAALTFTNATNSMMQLSTEPPMRGRVMAFRVAIALGGTPIGAPIVGWVANHFGPRWALAIGASSGLAAALVGVCLLTHVRLNHTRLQSVGPNLP
ncbi:MAG TPA: MFS transporter [Acidobacteriaceae bacterium]|jgi:MFS family permease|nr:MFS transporter [Acidobacteriaceae bacterium]